MIREISLRESVRSRVVDILKSGPKTIDRIMIEGFGINSGMNLNKTFVESVVNDSVDKDTVYTLFSENGNAKAVRINYGEDTYYLFSNGNS